MQTQIQSNRLNRNVEQCTCVYHSQFEFIYNTWNLHYILIPIIESITMQSQQQFIVISVVEAILCAIERERKKNQAHYPKNRWTE